MTLAAFSVSDPQLKSADAGFISFFEWLKFTPAEDLAPILKNPSKHKRTFLPASYRSFQYYSY